MKQGKNSPGRKFRKILVTGGAGFIGTNMVNLLLESGYKVAILDNLSSGYKRNINPRAKFYRADITKPAQLTKVFLREKPDAVIHAAAQVQVVRSMREPQFDAFTNIIGGINVLEACRLAKVKKIVYMCTGGALYGEPKYLPADENHPIEPISCYGASKRCLEYYVRLYGIIYGMDYAVVRFSNVYGPFDDPKSGRVIPNFILGIMKGKRPFITGRGSQSRDFVYVGDVVRGALLALEKNPKEKFLNIGTQTKVTINQLYLEVIRELKSKIKPVYVAERKGEVQQIYLSNKLAAKELGWKPKVSFRQGIKKTIEFFESRRQIFLGRGK